MTTLQQLTQLKTISTFRNWVADNHRRRRTIYTLSRLDARILNDIGIESDQIAAVADALVASKRSQHQAAIQTDPSFGMAAAANAKVTSIAVPQASPTGDVTDVSVKLAA